MEKEEPVETPPVKVASGKVEQVVKRRPAATEKVESVMSQLLEK